MSALIVATEAGVAAAPNQVVETASGAIGLGWLVPLVPLVGFVVLLFAGRRLGERAAWVATAAAAVSFVLSVAIFVQVAAQPATYVRPMPTWISAGSLDVSFDLLIDQLTTVMLLVVTGVGTLVHVYSRGYMQGDEHFSRFFAYLNLFLFSMLVLVLGSGFLTLFLGWELVGLCSYLLVGFWFENPDYASAAKKAFIVNRVGDVSFMIAMFLIFALVGSLSFVEVLGGAGTLTGGAALAVSLLLLGGATAKSAQIPLYVWLPDAMAGPTPVSALIHAATMVTAGVYLLVRSSPILVASVGALTVIAWIGVLTALLGALIALRQDDIKKILAYSTISQLGYMFLAIGVGGFAESIFHLTTHAFFKALLFLAAGSVMHAMANRTDAWRMGGLRKLMPVTFWTSAVAWLAISGIPPFAGFFSKDQILTTAFEHGFVGVWALGVVTAVLTAFYMSRWFFLIFLGEPRWRAGESSAAVHAGASQQTGRAAPDAPAEDTTGPAPSAQDAHVTQLHPHESPASMTVPLIVLGVLSVVAGFLLNPVHSGPLFNWLSPAVAGSDQLFAEPAFHLAEPVLIVISVLAGLLGIGLAYLVYLRRPVSSPQVSEPIRGVFATLLERKFYVDDLYDAVFVKAGGRVSAALVWFDERVIDGAVNGAGRLSQLTGDVTRRSQTGLLRGYVATFLVGAVGLVAFLFWQVG